MQNIIYLWKKYLHIIMIINYYNTFIYIKYIFIIIKQILIV